MVGNTMVGSSHIYSLWFSVVRVADDAGMGETQRESADSVTFNQRKSIVLQAGVEAWGE